MLFINLTDLTPYTEHKDWDDFGELSVDTLREWYLYTVNHKVYKVCSEINSEIDKYGVSATLGGILNKMELAKEVRDG